MRHPTIRQQRAILNLVENGGNMSKAIKDAGYSDAMAKNPDRVFAVPVVQSVLDKIGLSASEVLEVIRRKLDAKKFVQVAFSDDLELSDEDIKDYLQEANYCVIQIVSGKGQRVAMCVVNDSMVQLRAANILVRIMGFVPSRQRGSDSSHSTNDRSIALRSMVTRHNI